MTDKTGGSAFPNITPDMQVDGGPGMTLRQYYAGQAIQGILAGYWSNDSMAGLNPEALSEEAFAVADAMIAEGEKDG